MNHLSKLLAVSIPLILFSHFAYSQVTPDTTLANTIYQQARAHYNAIKLDSAYQEYETAGNIYQAAESWESYLKSRNFMARCLMRQGDFNSAIPLVDSALKTVKPYLSELNETTGNSYNVLGVAYNFLQREAEAVPYLTRALEIRQEVFGPESEEALTVYVNLGSCYMDLGEEGRAMDMYEEMVEILERTGQTESVAIGGGYYGLGVLHDRRWDYDKALYYYQKTLKVWSNIYGKEHPKIGEVYIALGTSYANKEEFNLAETSFQKSLSIYLNHFGEENLRVCLTIFNLGVLYERMKNYSQALSYHQKALELRTNIYGENHFSLSSGYNSIGNSHKALGNYDLANQNYEKAAILSEKNFNNINHTQYYALSNLGNIQELKGNYNEAIAFFQQSLSVLDSIRGAVVPLAADVMENMGQCYLGLGKYDSAEYYFQKGIDVLHTFAEVNRVNLDKLLIDTYYGLGSMYHYRFENFSNQPEDLQLAAQAFSQSINLADGLRKDFLTQEGRQDFIATTLKALSEYNQTNFELLSHNGDDSDLQLYNQILHNMEKGKSFSLLESVNDQRAKMLGGIPAPLVDQENELKKAISQLEEDIYHEQNKGSETDSMLVLSLEAEIFDLKSEFQELLASINRKYPHYVELKYGGKLPNVQQVQKFLGADRAMIEYQIGETGITTLLISKQEVKAFYQAKSDSLIELISNLRRTLEPEFQGTDEGKQEEFFHHSHELYKLLLAKPLAQLDSKIKTLIIIPDGAISYVPFDILIDQPDGGNSWQSFPYLIKKYQISMAYSVSILLENRSNLIPKNFFGGFAAAYETPLSQNDSLSGDTLMAMLVRDGELPLPGAINEVTTIAALLEGQAFTGENAREQIFKQKAEDFSILHMAMHALTADQNPLFSRLVFTPSQDSVEDNFLYAIELYNMKLRAQMAVLSACNTGLGLIKDGEGVMSLSRAFAYAGVPGLVMSLWSVPDDATSEIMINFYKGIKDEQNKDEALRNAKLEYLKNAKLNELTHPFYWAGFVPVGDMEPIRKPMMGIEHGLLIGLLTLLIALAFIYLQKRKKA